MSKRKRERSDGQDLRIVSEDAGTNSRPMNGDGEHMVAEAAYYIAAQRAFQGGDPTADWLQAEREIDTRFSGK